VLDDLLVAYSKVLHLDAPAERTIEALDKFVSSPNDHGGKVWNSYRLKYTVQSEKDGKMVESDELIFPDLVSLYTPAENDYLSRFVEKFLYFFFLVCLFFIVLFLFVPFLARKSNGDRLPNQPKPQST